LTARDLTVEENTDNRGGITEGRDYIAIEIRSKGEGWPHRLIVCVGSPIIMTQGHVWNADTAARSALSFASEPSCWDEPKDRAWVDCHGETLANEAYCHKVLGKETRKG
jgi:hypothetical protein